MKKLLLTFILVDLICSFSIADYQTRIDSLEKELKVVSGEEKIKVLDHLSYEYQKKSPLKSIAYQKQVVELSKKLSDKKSESNALNSIGISYYILSDYPKAIEYFGKSAKVSGDISDKKAVVKSLNNIGVIYQILGKYDKALKYYNKSLVMKKDLGDKRGIAKTLSNIAVIYQDLNDNDHALEFNRKALEIYKKFNDKIGLASSYNNMGVIYDNLQNKDKALEYYKKSLKIKEEIKDNRGIANTLNNIGLIYTKLGNYKKAGFYYKRSLKIRQKIGDKYGIASSMDNIGVLYFKTLNYKQSLIYLNKSLKIAEGENFKDIKKRNYLHFSQVYDSLKKYQKALENYQLYSAVKDSIFSDKTKKEIADIQVKYETEKKEKENEILRKKAVLQKLKIEYQKRTKNNIIYIFVLILVLISTLVVFILYKNKRKVNLRLQQINNELEERVKERTTKLQEEINQREKAERKLKKIYSEFERVVTTIPDVVYSGKVDSKGVYHNLYTTDIIEKITGRPKEFFIEKYERWNEIIYSDDLERMIEIYNKAYKGKIDKFEEEYRIILPDGKIRWVLEKEIVTKEPDGSIRFDCIISDITNRKKMEDELREAKNEAEAATLSKSMFLASLGHEIRSPINIILGMTQVLLDTDLTEEQIKFLNMITASGNNMLNIINNILDFSKTEAGQLKLENIEFNIYDETNSIIELSDFEARAKGIDLSVSFSPLVPKLLKGDPLRLKQIITNLVNNAIKFTKKGSIKIKVETLESENKLIKLKFQVIDTGIGISEEGKMKLFKAFSQTNTYTTRKYGGTGLGLAISKNLVTFMNGKIGVESEVGKGSTFWFTAVFEKIINQEDSNRKL